MNFFAKNITFLRKFYKLQQNEIPNSIGFGRTTWIAYEKGKSYPSFLDLLKISDYFKVTLSELVEMDISKNVHLNAELLGKKNTKDVRLNVQPSVLPISKRYKTEDVQKTSEEEEKSNVIQFRVPQVITIDSQGNENVIMVPIKARAGYLNGYADPEFMATLPAYRLPGLNNGTFRLFEVDGFSMIDSLNNRDVVICSYVEQLQAVRDDRVHVIMTKNDGIVIKTVLNRLKTDGKLILKSENYKERESYPSIVCEPNDIIEIWYCISFISRIFRRSSDIFRRTSDLEGRLTLLEEIVRKPKPK